MNKVVKVVKVIVASAAVLGMGLSGCVSTVAEGYATAAEINDASFKAAMMRVCGVTAGLAANRVLTPLGAHYRTGLCQQWALAQQTSNGK